MNEEKFSPWRFLLVIAVIFSAVLMLMRFCLPQSLWYVQVHATSAQYVIAFTVSQVLNCFAEWYFHRYMLHAPLIPISLFHRFFKQHNDIHHRLTNVQAMPKDAPVVWKNRFPIIEPKQYEASFFPWYAYLAFLAPLAPFAILIQLALPGWPILIVALASVGWSLCMYELIHAVEHLKMAFWEGVFKVSGIFGEKVYSFHVVHHAHIRCNEAVSGFLCGIPLADIFFGTLKVPQIVFRDGAGVIPDDLKIPKPWFRHLRVLDVMAKKSIRAYRKRALEKQM
jgi:hemolysin III